MLQRRFPALSLAIVYLLTLGTHPAEAVPVTLTFREPKLTTYTVQLDPITFSLNAPAWIQATNHPGQSNPVALGSRVVLRVDSEADLNDLISLFPLTIDRRVGDGSYILQAPDAWTAAQSAAALSQQPGVLICHPVRCRLLQTFGAYAPAPDDPYFPEQWYLEHRNGSGTKVGTDIDARGAWPFANGAGVTLAIVDDGVELDHPEFVAATDNDLHYNFKRGNTEAVPLHAQDNHGTAVAGFAASARDNGIGVSGIASGVRLVSWKIFDTAWDPYNPVASEEQLMDMFQSHSNVVAVQNHSWGNAGASPNGPGYLEDLGIENAIRYGRDGLGVVMVRAVPNGRVPSFFQSVALDANDDGFAGDPRVIAVSSVRADGRAATYSSRGANILVAAPGGDTDRDLRTTDRQGSGAGWNTAPSSDDSADYVSSPNVRGTSFACPQISGVAALILSTNPSLTYRDVQQIMLLSAVPPHVPDPDLLPNGSGLRVSHDSGYGVPDAGLAVSLAKGWSNRPPLEVIRKFDSRPRSIPDDGLRVDVQGTNIPLELQSIPASPTEGIQPDQATDYLRVVDVGFATNSLSEDLHGKAALIERGPAGEFPDGRNYFSNKIGRAAESGARFAIVYNNQGTDERVPMGATEYVPIPAVFISRDAGLALRQHLSQDTTALTSLRHVSARYQFNINTPLLLEHVGVTIRTSQTNRSDLRITLTSPMKTTSVFSRLNGAALSEAVDWTFYSTHHFYESSVGTWTIDVTDELPGITGRVLYVELILHGVSITDTDSDGLDDTWEDTYWGNLLESAANDPDEDGYPNSVEQVIHTDPLTRNLSFTLETTPWSEDTSRLSWPGTTQKTYRIQTSTGVGEPFQTIADVPGRFPETDWISPSTPSLPANSFIRVQEIDAQ